MLHNMMSLLAPFQRRIPSREAYAICQNSYEKLWNLMVTRYCNLSCSDKLNKHNIPTRSRVYKHHLLDAWIKVLGAPPPTAL
jgi:hypothetical protein